MRKFLIIWIVIASLGTGTVAAGLNPEIGKQLRFTSGVPDFELSEWDSGYLRSEVQDLSPTESVEVLYFLPFSSEMTVSEAADLVQGALLRVSGMTGLEYQNEDGQTMTLYHDVYVVASPDDRTRLPDPEPDDLEDELQLYVLQNDDDFGEAVMRITITRDDFVRIRVQNATRLRMGIIPAVSAENMIFYFEIRSTEQGVYIYGVGALSTVRLGFLRGMVRRHLETRADALVQWLSEGL